MRILTRSIFKQAFLLQFVISIGILTLITFLLSFKIFKYVNLYGSTVYNFMQLLLLRLPDIIPLIMPITMGLTVIIIYNRYYIDSELNAIRSSGISSKFLYKPFLLVSLITFFISSVLCYYYIPISKQKFELLRHNIRQSIDHTLLLNGIFYNFDDVTIYIHKKDQYQIPKGVFIEDHSQENKIQTIVAEQTLFVPDKNGFKLQLLKGTRFEYDTEKNETTFIKFDKMNFSLDFFDHVDPTNLKKYYFITDILGFNPNIQIPPDLQLYYSGQAHSLIVMPFLVFSITVIILLILNHGDYQRQGLRYKNLFSLVALFSYFGLFYLFKNASQKLEIGIFLLYFHLCVPYMSYALYQFISSRNRMRRVK